MIQTTIWDLLQREAVCILNGRRYPAVPADGQARELVPGGAWTILAGGHTMVLSPVQEVPEGQRYRHFQVDGQLYAGTFIGAEAEPEEGERPVCEEGI